MARTVTLGQLKADIRDQADIAGATTRTVGTLLNRLINQSIQRFRERVSQEGESRYLQPYSSTFTAGNTSPYPFQALDLSGISPAMVRSFMVTVTVNNVVTPLKHIPFRSHTDFGNTSLTGIPRAWAHYKTDTLAILPGPDSAYSYTVWYLPVLADLTNDSDTFDGVAGWEEYVIWDVVCRSGIRDKYPEFYQMAMAERGQVWEDVLRGATRVTYEGGARIARDSLGERLRLSGRSRGYLPPP